MQEMRVSGRKRRRYRVKLGPISAYTTDVSGGGFCTEVMRVLPPRTAVEGAIEVDGKPVPFEGVIAWVARGAWHLNVRGRMGVRFTRIAPDAARLFDPRSAAMV
ncbi:MAG TPA: PilZ domain-containing protein [Anaeromyxobacteraceae bacterium]|nr:PilZ domain-containing protein [Anaeromyxobacteraceae bacterium]